MTQNAKQYNIYIDNKWGKVIINTADMYSRYQKLLEYTNIIMAFHAEPQVTFFF